MLSAKRKFQTIDEYIDTFPKDVQDTLERVRQTIRKAVPKAEETISYQIPTFRFHGKNLAYFAAWKNHIALYAIPKGDAVFKKELSPYIAGKGTLRFPIDKPIPARLISKVVRYSVKETPGWAKRRPIRKKAH